LTKLFYRSEDQLVAAKVDSFDGFTVLGREPLFDTALREQSRPQQL